MKISNSSIHNLIKFNYLTKNFRLHDNFYQRKGAMGLINRYRFFVKRRNAEEALNSQVLNAVEAEDKDKRRVGTRDRSRLY